MKITLGLIVRNEEVTLEKCLESVRPYVDEIIIGLAGTSTDSTPKIAKKYADRLLVIPWNDHFSDARNAIFEYVDSDYFMWLDGDDELINGDKIRGHIEQHPEVGAFHMGYDYGHGPNGESLSFLVRERIVKSGMDWHWEGRVHEYLTTDTPHDIFYIPDVLVKHTGTHKIRGTRNLDLLYKDLEEAEPSPPQRLLFYLGREEMLKGNDKQAILHLNRFVAGSQWEPEAYQAQHSIADILRRNGQLDQAEQADQLAIRMQPAWADAYFGLAEVAFRRGEWQTCIEWTKVATGKEVPQTSLVINPRDYDFNPLLIYAISCVNIGDYEMALKNYQTAYEISPSEALRNTLVGIRSLMSDNKVLNDFLGVIEHLASHDEWLKVRKIFESAPKTLETHPKVRELWSLTLNNTAHIENPQLMEDFYKANPGWVPFDETAFEQEIWKNHPRMNYARQVLQRTQAQNMLDLGSSDGFISIPLAMETGVTIDGIDLDPRCVDLANRRAQARKLNNVTYHEGNISILDEWTSCNRFSKYDLALLFETIEHVVDPAGLLEQVERAANHIAITTPHLAWENGLVDWRKPELKGHLRIFDLADIEMLLTPRGRINNLYVEPWGSSGWIFADYAVGNKPAGSNISIVCPAALEKWGPRKLQNDGLGGSELAVIRLAEELADLDNRVTVFNTIDNPGYYNSVRYRDYEQFIPDVHSDMLIAWRYPSIADQMPNTERLVLWMHDVHSNEFTEDRYEKFAAIILLTEWHKQYFLAKYPFVDSKKVFVIGNGVDPGRFDQRVKRNSNRVVYASSPDRGLDVILEHIWPKVIEEVPDAELHYYYGWSNFDTLSQYSNEYSDFKRKVAELTMNTTNVFNHGRITQGALATEMLKGSVWLYPTYFAETYCIVGVEAQAAGLVPVYNPFAGLNDTIKSGVPIEGDVRDPAVGEKYAAAVIQLLNNPPKPQARRLIQEKAPAHSWADIAQEWTSLF